jgi:uncharacterized membrane protein YccC
MPAMFAIGVKVIGNPAVATFAAFGSFAMILLVEFSGTTVDRLRSQAALVVAGATLVCLGTLASNSTWLATLAMALVGFCVLFAGVVSSVLAGATVALLLAFILPVSIAAPVAQVPDRVAGWGMAGAASLLAIAFLWPAPAGDRLRQAATAACRAIAARLRADAVDLLEHRGETRAQREHAVERADVAAAALSRTFLATPYRPTGLSSAARAVVRLVDEIAWLKAIVDATPVHAHTRPSRCPVCSVNEAAASVLEQGADLLERPQESPERLHGVLAELRTALSDAENGGAVEVLADTRPTGASAAQLVSALDPGFRAQELAFAVSQIAQNVDIAAAADRRPWRQRLLGRMPATGPGSISAARRRAFAHLEPHSVWLHNSLRGAAGLSLAVLVASVTGVQHSFWVILGTLSVLRSNALNTGQNVFRGLLGTAAGVVIGAALLAVIGTNAVVLWFLLPVAVLGAGFAPAAVSFAAGQAAFTVTLVILYNIIEPTGWHVGLIRIQDAALGFAISLAVGVLFWPRGAITALGHELSEAYSESARCLGAAVEFGLARTHSDAGDVPEPQVEMERAAAAARRLDDAFRTYLAERAAKPVPLAEVTALVNGVVALRMTAEAVIDLWLQQDRPVTVDHADTRGELRALALGVVGWYEILAAALGGGARVPDPLSPDTHRTERLVDAVGRTLDAGDAEIAMRVIWTGDHLDAARRLQAVVAVPAGSLVEWSSPGRTRRAQPVGTPAEASLGDG